VRRVKWKNYRYTISPDRIKYPKIVIRRNLVTALCGLLIRRGNKKYAESVTLKTLVFLCKKFKDDPLQVLIRALNNIKPSLNIYTKKRGGTSYKLPILLDEDQQYKLALRWLVINARKRAEKTFTLRLINEILESYYGKNITLVRRRDELHKNALASRPFLRFK